MNIEDLEGKIINADCMELMESLPDGSVDVIITDPPYGITANNWDKTVDFALMWKQFERLCPLGSKVLFGLSGFTVDLINSNRKNLRHWWIWYKHLPAGFLSAKKAPLRVHEDILVFCKKGPAYYPQMTKGKPYIKKRTGNSSNYFCHHGNITATDMYYPISILDFPAVVRGFHPTQKPLELLQYLINTYTLPGQIVLDPFSGSGTTAIACHSLKRRFICIEKDHEYWAKSVDRLKAEQMQLQLF